MELTNLEIIEKVARYQNSGYFHELTCRNEECRDILIPQERDKKVILVCPSCDYTQEYIPECVLTIDYLMYELAERRKQWEDVLIKERGQDWFDNNKLLLNEQWKYILDLGF